MVDIDPRNGGDDSLEALIAKYGPFPKTAEQVTGGGGRHIFLRYNGGRVPKTVARGVDLKGEGGYVVAAPSLHVSGSRYQWDRAQGEGAQLDLADAPSWLLEIIHDSGSSGDLSPPPARGYEKMAEGTRNNRLTSLAGSMRRRGMSREAIEVALLEENRRRCDPPLPEAEIRGIVASVVRYPTITFTGSGQEEAWPEPPALQAELPPVEDFHLEFLPRSLHDLVHDVSERMQAPPDFAAAAAVVGLAGAVGRRALIQPKEYDTGWVVTPNLWGGVIARPGFMKSPTIQAIMYPIRQIQVRWFEENARAYAEYEQERELHAIEVSAWKIAVKARLKAGEPKPERPALAGPPQPRRLVVVDATFEKLHEVMQSNPGGVLVLRDELTGWLAQLDKPGRETERAFCLESWNGDSPFTVERVGRGTLHVDNVCMSLFGGIQPGKLRGYLAEALRDGPGDDGLIQRFQVIVWPNVAADWKLIDREPDRAAQVQAAHVFGRLVELEVKHPILFRFAPNAQELFFEWYSELQRKVRGECLHPALASHLSKYAKLMPALALLFELADQGAAGPFSSERVSLVHAQQAAAFCSYLESHAKRIYSCIVSPEMRAASELAEHLRRKDIGQEGAFSLRDVYRPQWTGLDTPERASAAVRVLVDWDWVRETFPADKQPGRASERYLVNPKIRSTR